MSASEDTAIEADARLALHGDRKAVARLVSAVQHDIFGIALRMLWSREDAEDATQEILVRMITRLAQFDFRSRLRTWVYRVAVNHLLDVKKTAFERNRLSFDSFADDLAVGLTDEGPSETERSILAEEVKVGCTLGMLQCLDRPHRVAYILGAIMQLPADEAAEAVNTSASTFRKRLQRARESVEAFTKDFCGLRSDTAPCRCNKRVNAAVALGRANTNEIQYAVTSRSFEEAKQLIRDVEQARQGLAVHRLSHPKQSDVDFAKRVVSALTAAR